MLSLRTRIFFAAELITAVILFYRTYGGLTQNYPPSPLDFLLAVLVLVFMMATFASWARDPR